MLSLIIRECFAMASAFTAGMLSNFSHKTVGSPMSEL